MAKYRLGILCTHPVQYYVPWYRARAADPEIDLNVFYAQHQTGQGQAAAGFGVAFEWDIPLLGGYPHEFLINRAHRPDVSRFFGCDTPAIENRIRQSSFDAFIVQGWNTRSYWQAIKTCWTTRTPLLVRGDSQLGTPRSWPKRLLKEGLYRWFIPRFDGYLVVGKRSADYYRHYGAPPAALFHVPHAVDNDFFASHQALLFPDRSALRESWGIPADAIIFLFAGKLLPRKRPEDFLHAVKEAASKNAKVWGLVVGDGPLRRGLEDRVRREQLPIRFAGFLNQKEIPRAYTAADALVLPSDGSETWGLVVNEAMASGLPAFVSQAAGCQPDLVQSGETGASFPCGDVRALGELLRQASTASQLAAMGQSARAAVAHYSIAEAVRGTVDALRYVAVNSARLNSGMR